jgi:hypothetical protein
MAVLRAKLKLFTGPRSSHAVGLERTEEFLVEVLAFLVEVLAFLAAQPSPSPFSAPPTPAL